MPVGPLLLTPTRDALHKLEWAVFNFILGAAVIIVLVIVWNLFWGWLDRELNGPKEY